MITLYGFGRIFPAAHGETKDLRVQWVLEETGLPYRVHALDHTAGELDGAAFSALGPFHQAPVLDDDGFVIAESAAIALYLAGKSGRLIPGDAQARARVTQWCFAATSTVEPTLLCLDMISIFGHGEAEPENSVRQIAQRWLRDLERHLEPREWIAGDAFTVADVLMSCVLRGLRKRDLMTPFPAVRSYYARCFERPAWQRTLALYAERVGADINDIR